VQGKADRIREQGREALHPSVDGDVVNLNAAFGQQLFDVAVRQALPQVPAHRDHDDLGREPKAGEGRAGWRQPTRAGGQLHPAILPESVDDRSTQQRPLIDVVERLEIVPGVENSRV
jgi:hypothetical protein